MEQNTPKFRVVLFDLDGTLISSEVMAEQVLKQLFFKYKNEQVSDQLRASFTGMPTRQILAHIDPDNVEGLLAECVELEKQYRSLSYLYPGVLDTLRTLVDAGIHLGTITSETRSELCGVREHFPLDDLIDIWISSDDVSQPKPHPESVLLALEYFQVQCSQVLFVGDSSYDLEAGKSAGVAFGAALWGCKDYKYMRQKNPKYEFHHPGDIVNLCLRM